VRDPMRLIFFVKNTHGRKKKLHNICSTVNESHIAFRTYEKEQRGHGRETMERRIKITDFFFWLLKKTRRRRKKRKRNRKGRKRKETKTQILCVAKKEKKKSNLLF
jgi:hypothetical protein